MINPNVNAKKYWNVAFARNDDSAVFEWGRIGTSGQQIEKEYPTAAAAEKAIFKKINEKIGEGYKQVPC